MSIPVLRRSFASDRCVALVVEDEALIAVGLEGLLLEMGADTVTWATRTDEALRLIASADPPYALAVVDWLLSRASAEGVVRALVAAGTPVLVFTGAPERVTLDGDGAVVVLGKPAHDALIRASIRRVLLAASAHQQDQDDDRDRYTEEPK